jgi:hypothetical protein
MTLIPFTKTESLVLSVLADGLRHTKTEIEELLEDNGREPSSLWMHVSNINSKLKPHGRKIVCELYQAKTHYRHVILLKPEV